MIQFLIQLIVCSSLFVCLQCYQTTKPTKFYVDKRNFLDIIPSAIPFVLRLGSGALISNYKVTIEPETDANVNQYTFLSLLGYRISEKSSITFKNRPVKYLEIYEFEGCPFCKKVREAVSILDLEVLFKPCPRGSPVFRPFVKKLGGKFQFPYLVDSNTGTSMYESSDIIEYLYDTYGPVDNNVVPDSLGTSFYNTLSLSIASLLRLGKGAKFVENKYNPSTKKPIIYYGYEGSPFCKIVREKLVEYEIPHIQKTCPRGSSRRQELLDQTGRFQVPYIEDPNTGDKLFESADINAYLDTVYGF